MKQLAILLALLCATPAAAGSVPEAEAEVIACVHRAMRDGAAGHDAIMKVCEGYYREFMWACQLDLDHRGQTYESAKNACAWGLLVAENEAEHGRR